MSRPPTSPPGTEQALPWDLSFLRVGALASLVVATPAVLVAGLLAGWAGVTAVVLGAAVVTAFFVASGAAVAWAGRTLGDTATLPAALGMFGMKLFVLFVLLEALPAVGWLDPALVGWTVFVGVLLWTGVQMRWVWTRQLYYTRPPAPPADRT